MKYGSVCSGVEAATLAWHSLGWQPVFFSEIDKHANAVLKHHWPETICYGDFRTIKDGKKYNEPEPIDLLVGGTPCQDFSVAGLRKGITGDRGNLTLEFLRLAQRLRPKWLVWENVPGVLSDDGGKSFGAVLGGMAELGYGFAYRVLDAQYYGVAQRRRRVFVVGYFGDWRPPAAVLFERESLSGHPTPRRQTGESVAPTLDVRSGRSGENNFATSGGLAIDVAHTLRGEGFDASEDGSGRGTPLTTYRMQSFGKYQDDDTASTLKSRDFKNATDLIAFDCRGTEVQTNSDNVSMTLRSMAHDKSHINGGGHVAIAFAQNSRDEVRLVGGDGAISGALSAQPGMKQTSYVATAIPIHDKATRHKGGGDTRNDDGCSNGFGIGAPGDPAPTLDTASRHGVAQTIDFRNLRYGEEDKSGTLQSKENGGYSLNYMTGVQQGMAVRRLTPLECERLQGMPDNHTLVPFGKKMMSDAARYKMIGNSMAVPVMRKIGERINLINNLMEKSDG